MTQLKARRIAIAAVAVCLIGFLSMHDYLPGYGVVWNAWNGKIDLTAECPPASASEGVTLGPPLTAAERLLAEHSGIWRCGLAIPYRWILIAAVAVVAISFGIAQKKN